MKRTIVFLFLISSLVFGQTIVISEIMQNPVSVNDEFGEWFELYNPTEINVDINGWRIRDNGTNKHIINNDAPLFVTANGFLILGNNSDNLTNGGVTIQYKFPSTWTLTNSDDEIIIEQSDGLGGWLLIDEVNYDGGVNFPDPTGASMYFIGNFSDDNNLGSNWKESTVAWSGSAGDLGSPGSQGEGALPVELTTFSASLINKKVNLIWETATEVNNYGFNIERKTELGNWKKIAFVIGNGNSNSPKHYFYSDNLLFESGKYFYRLKQIDIDGNSEYSEEIEICFASPEKFELLQNYPNPFNPVTKIKFSIPDNAGIEQKVVLKIYNVLGQVVKTLVNENKQPGNYEIEFNGSDLMSGIYFYKIESGNFIQMRKMVLTK